MSAALLKSALKLSKAERILLVEQIWDSVAEDSDALRLSKNQEAELERRLERLERTGSQGSSWAKVKSRLKS